MNKRKYTQSISFYFFPFLSGHQEGIYKISSGLYIGAMNVAPTSVFTALQYASTSPSCGSCKIQFGHSVQ